MTPATQPTARPITTVKADVYRGLTCSERNALCPALLELALLNARWARRNRLEASR